MLEVAGGWNEVLLRFLSDHVPGMERYADRTMILLIDFDARERRLEEAKGRIPENLADRVFLLGAFSEPEALKKALSDSYEGIGRKLAQDCREGTDGTWGHPLLRHNAAELDRLRTRVNPILFRGF